MPGAIGKRSPGAVIAYLRSGFKDEGMRGQGVVNRPSRNSNLG